MGVRDAASLARLSAYPMRNLYEPGSRIHPVAFDLFLNRGWLQETGFAFQPTLALHALGYFLQFDDQADTISSS